MLDQNPGSQPLSPQPREPVCLDVSLCSPSASKWPNEDDATVTRPGLPHRILL